MATKQLKYVKDRIYIAGVLDSCGYLQNLSRMLHHGELIRKLGGVPFVPGNDFTSRLMNGQLKYKDVINASLGLLDSSDALYLVPGWEDSQGVQNEIEYAQAHNIPILCSIEAVKTFLNRPKILCIIGESGSGKTTIAEIIEAYWGIETIQSHTDRPKRSPDENGHIFHTPEEFDEFQIFEMIAYTDWDGNRYCCLHEDVKQLNTYIIDESGYSMLKTKHGARYNVRGLRVHRDDTKRIQAVGEERANRDSGKFRIYPGDFDFHVDNNGTIEDLINQISPIIKHFFTKEAAL